MTASVLKAPAHHAWGADPGPTANHGDLRQTLLVRPDMEALAKGQAANRSCRTYWAKNGLKGLFGK